MATKIIPSLRSALERLKHAGAVNGLCLGWRRQVLVNLLPFEGFRAEKLLHVMREVREHFASGGREIETFWFGFDGVHVLICFKGECSLAVLHCRAVEVDFLCRAAHAFLSDSQLLVDAALNASGSDAFSTDTQKILGETFDSEGDSNLISRVML